VFWHLDIRYLIFSAQDIKVSVFSWHNTLPRGNKFRVSIQLKECRLSGMRTILIYQIIQNLHTDTHNRSIVEKLLILHICRHVYPFSLVKVWPSNYLLLSLNVLTFKIYDFISRNKLHSIHYTTRQVYRHLPKNLTSRKYKRKISN
jgi:hypothetical protein